MTNALTSFQDQTVQEISAPKSKQIPVPDPYPSQGMEAVISRLMKINNFTWDTTDVQGSIIGSVSLPGDLLAVQSIWERIGRFKYFRADLELQIRTNTTRFHYGQLLMYQVPDTSSAEVTALVTDLWEASQLKPTVILANSGTELTIKIPYQHQYDFIDLEDSTTDVDAIARVGFVVLQPLHSANADADDSLDVTVWARFTNVRVSGPKTTLGTKPTLTAMPKSRRVLKTKLDAINLGHRKKAAAAAEKRKKRKTEPESEQDAKSRDGMTTGVGERISNFASNFTSIPIIGGLASAADAVGGLLSDIGLNMPNNTAAPMRTMQLGHVGGLLGKGLDPSIGVTLDPAAHVSDSQDVYGVNDPACHSFKALAMTPALFDAFDIPSTTAAESIIASFPLTPAPLWVAGTRYDNWLAAAARQFLFWRGSIKYMFVFSCSSFTTARVRLTYHPDDVGSSAEADNGGDVISQIVDIKGDTVSRITIPYLHSKPYSRTPSGTANSLDFSNGKLVMSLVNRIIDFDTTVEDTAIQCSVWIAGGEDTSFCIPVTPQVPAPAEPEGDIEDAFKLSFPPIIKAVNHTNSNYVVPEDEMSIRTYLHRYVHFYLLTATATFAPFNLFPPYGSATYTSPLWTFFRFRRGTMRFWFSKAPNDTSSVGIGYTYATSGIGSSQPLTQTTVAYYPPANDPNIFFSVPYASNQKFEKRAQSALDREGVIVVPNLYSGTAGQIACAVGDDFSFGGRATCQTMGPS